MTLKIKHRLEHKVKKEKDSTKHKKILVTCIGIFIVVLIGGLVFIERKVNTEGKEIGNNIEAAIDDNDNEEEENKKAQLEKAEKQLEEIKYKVNDILGENAHYYGIYYCDLNTGLEYSVNGDEEFRAASTIKVPIAMMIADKLYNKELSESTLIEYTSADKEDGAGVLQGEVTEGTKIEVSKLMEYMIEESDNVATSMLKRNVGNVQQYIKGITSIEVKSEDNIIKPQQSGLILKRLYEGSNSNFYYKKIIEYMKRTSTHDRLDKYIPNNIVAHKIGDYDKYVNDVGIIYTEEPYILSVYTKDVMEEGRENIAKISKTIYEMKTTN